MRFVLCVIAIIGLAAVSASADEKLKGIACRSVHLGYAAPEGIAFYTEMTVEKTADGTYFMAAGWSKGYFGIQELASGKKLVLFSVWDTTAGNDPKKVEETKRIKLRHKDKAVRVQRFGGEGTGGQSFFDYDWKIGETYRFLVTAKPDGDARNAYGGYFFIPEKKEGPAETDMVKFFRVTPPAAHSMVVKLEELALVTREPGVARSIRVAIPEEEIPTLEESDGPPW